MLLVGNYYDPATSYRSAQKAHGIMPHSWLMSSNSWGHTAYGTSDCIIDGIDQYLIHGTKPPTFCESQYKPFDYRLDSTSSDAVRNRTGYLSPMAATGLPKLGATQE